MFDLDKARQSNSPERIPSPVLEKVITILIVHEHVPTVKVRVPLLEDISQNLPVGGALVYVAIELVNYRLGFDFPYEYSRFMRLASCAEAFAVSYYFAGNVVAFYEGDWEDGLGQTGDEANRPNRVVDIYWKKN